MGAIQSIIEIANRLTIQNRRVVGIQQARNEIVLTNETPTTRPWRFRLSAAGQPYNRVRSIIQGLDDAGSNVSEVIKFGVNNNLKWLFGYQGTLSITQRNQVSLASFSGNQLVLSVSGISGATSSDVIVEAGDVIQLQGHPYPFAATSRVLKGSGSTVVVTTHRPNILSTTPAAGTKFKWGSDCEWRVLCIGNPTYTLVPGAAQRDRLTGTIINNAIVEWDGEFELIEHTALA